MLNIYRNSRQMVDEPLFWIVVGLLITVTIVYFYRVQREIKSRRKKINQLIISNDTVQIVHEYKKKEADHLAQQCDEQSKNLDS